MKQCRITKQVPVEKPGLRRKREGNEKIKKKKKKHAERKNTSVYVTGLPHDVTVEELEGVFRKSGVILTDLITNKPKIKLYTHENGDFKGEALVIYLREESVLLACQLLDDMEFRYGQKAKIKVSPAVFAEKQVEQNSNAEMDISEIKMKNKAIHEMHKYLKSNLESLTGMKMIPK